MDKSEEICKSVSQNHEHPVSSDGELDSGSRIELDSIHKI